MTKEKAADIRLIAMDMDGTLLNGKKEIPERTKQALIKLQDQGVILVLASGRPARGLERFARQLKMDEHGGVLISSNGARAEIFNGKVLYEHGLTKEQTRRVLEHLKQFDVIPMIAHEENMLVDNVYNCWIELDGKPWNVMDYEAHSNGFLLREVEDLAKEDLAPEKILTAGTPAYLQEIREQMAAPFEDLDSMFTGPFYYEYTARNTNKGPALKHVLEQLNLKPEQAVAFGDAENDLPMFEQAGTSVAMGNAAKDIQEKADDVTASNEEEGIACWLEKNLNL